jgi:hypothetical protein
MRRDRMAACGGPVHPEANPILRKMIWTNGKMARGDSLFCGIQHGHFALGLSGCGKRFGGPGFNDPDNGSEHTGSTASGEFTARIKLF